MTTNYELWITGNGEAEKLMIPVLPEKFTVTLSGKNSTVDVTGLGEIIIKQSRPALQFAFSSFFPSVSFPGMTKKTVKDPLSYVETITSWMEGKKPVHLIFAGLHVDAFCTIEKFPHYEQGGDVGTIYYDMTLKEYREVTVRQIKIGEDKTTGKKKGTVQKGSTRVDNKTTPRTHTVVRGDCLWNLAKKYYGDGSKYTKIYEANKKIIGGNPNLIYVGQVLTIPEL